MSKVKASTIMQQAPLVSIGLPVFNGEAYLGSALDSLLAQDYSNYELIISDNCSTDGTESICRKYAARDARIRYYRATQNMGPSWNFTRVYELARGEYFMWAAHDDLRHPQCLSLCVNALENDRQALLCCMETKIIDEQGHDITSIFLGRNIHPVGSHLRERVRALTQSTYWLDFYSLIRTAALAETRLYMPVWGADVILLTELCLRGRAVEVAGNLFSYRYFPAKTNEAIAESLSPAHSVAPSWNHFTVEMIKSVWLAPLSLQEKLTLSLDIYKQLALTNLTVSKGIKSEGMKYVVNVLRANHKGCAMAMIVLFAVTRLGLVILPKIETRRRAKNNSGFIGIAEKKERKRAQH